jgi:hypothetical protein
MDHDAMKLLINVPLLATDVPAASEDDFRQGISECACSRASEDFGAAEVIMGR